MLSATPSSAPEAGSSGAGIAPLQAAPPVTAEALIAEAREHARRRRRRAALVTVIVAASIGGGLIAAGVFNNSGRTTIGGPGRPVPLAARAGLVTGHLDPCVGVILPGRPYTPVFAAGTVTALRGIQTWQHIAGGRLQLPAGAPAARERVARNQPFALSLAAGQYTLVARYDGGAGSFITVTVRAGQVVQRDFPDICK